MLEKWRTIPNYEGYYEISTFGRIKSIDRDVPHPKYGFQHRKSRMLKPSLNKKGYLIVVLAKDGMRRAYTVHRLVAKTFLPNTNNTEVINHKDENKTNNRVDNLEWCSQKYNINYGNSLKKRARSQSLSNIGKHYSPKTELKKGARPWNKGIKQFTPEAFRGEQKTGF